MPVVLGPNMFDGSGVSMAWVPEPDYDGPDGRVVATLGLHMECTEAELAIAPRHLRIGRPKSIKVLPDVIGWSTGPWILSPRLRAVIDRLEPGVQRYLPIKITTDKPFLGTTDHGDYFLLLAPPRIDCVVKEKTEFCDGLGTFESSRSEITGQVLFASSQAARVVLRRDVIAGRHVWQLPEGWQPTVIVSDEVWAAYKAEKMKGWNSKRTVTVE